MKQLAEMIGDLHYETLTKLMYELKRKFERDAYKDRHTGRIELAAHLFKVRDYMFWVHDHISDAWQISKPFMNK